MPEPKGIAPDGERIAALEIHVVTLRDDVAEIKKGQDEIKEMIAKASGGLKVIIWLGGAALSATGVLKYLSASLHSSSR